MVSPPARHGTAPVPEGDALVDIVLPLVAVPALYAVCAVIH